jgi:Short C-terminal domain
MQNLTPEGLRIVTDAAKRHGVSLDGALVLLGALARGNGRQAQFNHADLGGMGQWSQGGMIMIGDMFNQGLKYRVDALCSELAGILHVQPFTDSKAESSQSQTQSSGGEFSLFVAGAGPASQWWPAELGSPASTGAQNDLRYACFPGSRQLAVQQGGQVRVYDTGEHTISGFSQQQGGDRSLTFTSQFGLVRIADLALVSPRSERFQNPSSRASATPSQTPGPAPSAAAGAAPAPSASLVIEDIAKTIERLAELRQKNILTEEEFAEKKAELLSRL